jgi:glycerol uptake facilitator-like aquaporin
LIGKMFWLRGALEACGAAALLAAGVAAVILPERLWAFDGGSVLAAPAVCALVTAALAGIFRAGYFNPALTLAAAAQARISVARGAALSAAQMAGACAGVIAAQAAFNLDAVQEPAGAPLSLTAVAAEFGASFAFVSAVAFSDRLRWPRLIRAAAAGATFFALAAQTPLMSFANPAAAIARTLTSNALSLSPAEAGAAVAAQLLGAVAAGALAAKPGVRGFSLR